MQKTQKTYKKIQKTCKIWKYDLYKYQIKYKVNWVAIQIVSIIMPNNLTRLYLEIESEIAGNVNRRNIGFTF